MPARTKFEESAILAAAAEEIADAGFEGASVAAIARRLGAPSGSIYHRFPSKQHLFGALWVDIFDAYRAALAPILRDHESPVDLAVAVVHLIFDWVGDNPISAALLMRFRTEDFDERDWPDEVVTKIRACNESLAADLAVVAARHELDRLDVILALIDVPASASRRSILLDDQAATDVLRSRATQLATALLTGAL